MKIGQIAMLHVDAFPNRTIKARIDSFAPASGAVFSLLPPHNATGNFTKIVQRVPAKIRLARAHSPAGRLVHGSSDEVALDLRSSDGTPLVAPPRMKGKVPDNLRRAPWPIPRSVPRPTPNSPPSA